MDKQIFKVMETHNNDKLIVKCGNTKDALRDIAKKINFQYDENWNTRTFGSKIIASLGGKEGGFVIKDEYIVAEKWISNLDNYC